MWFPICATMLGQKYALVLVRSHVNTAHLCRDMAPMFTVEEEEEAGWVAGMLPSRGCKRRATEFLTVGVNDF